MTVSNTSVTAQGGCGSSPGTTTLLPCPFCGAAQDIDQDICDTGVFWVRCSECCAESEAADTREDAIGKWNRRASLQPATPTGGEEPKSELAKLIAAKMSEPAFQKLANAWPLREMRYLSVIKMSPCAVSDWYVTLPSGREIILSNDDWEAATPTAMVQSSAQSCSAGSCDAAIWPLVAESIKESLAEGDGFWRACSGCHETEDGQNIHGYPHSEVFGCTLGSGCSECGGIGAVWDTTDYGAMADEMHAEMQFGDPAQPPMDREQLAKVFAYIWHGDLGEWRGFLSKADAFLAYPMTSTEGK